MPTRDRGARRAAPLRARREEEIGTRASILTAVASGAATNRAALARRLGLAPSTVTVEVGDLVRRGVLRDAGDGPATGGRPARILEPVAGAGHLLAVAVGPRSSRVAVLDLGGSLVSGREVALDAGRPVEAVLGALLDAAAVLPGRTGPLRALGVSVPGPVDVVAGAVDSAAALPGWDGFPLAATARALSGVPVAVENDANAAAFAEFACRMSADGPGPRSLLLVQADDGVGCGLVVDGRLFRGATALGGDIAHVRVRAAGDAPCPCGQRGCLETVVGNAGIGRALRDLGIPAWTPADTARFVREGNASAVARVQAAGRLLGDSLATVVNFVNPHVVVLAGGLAACEPFVAAIRAQLSADCHPLALRALRLERAAAGPDAALTGVGALALRGALATL